MIDRGYTARELVGLPGMPANSERSVSKHEKSRGMVRVPGAKPIQWFEWSLPPETRAAIGARGAVSAAVVSTSRPSPTLPSPADEALIDARLEVLRAFECWRLGVPEMVQDQALYAFAGLYNAAGVEVAAETRRLIARVSRSQLLEWKRRLRSGGVRALALARGRRKRSSTRIDADPDLPGFIEAQIAERPLHLRRGHIMAAIRATFPRERWPSYRRLCEWVTRWLEDADNARKLSQWSNPDAHRSKYLPAFGDAAGDVDGPNVLWEGDGSPADVECLDGRVKRLAWIDVGTRCASIWLAPGETTDAVLASFRRFLLERGAVERVRTDNGPGFVSYRFRRVCEDLEIEHEICPPDQPQRKPFIERFLGQVAREVDELCPGFHGHSVAEQVAIRGQKSHAARRGEHRHQTFRVALTVAELQQRYDDWLSYVHHRRPHSGLDGRTPELAAAGFRPRKIDDERILDVLLAEAPRGDGVCTVQKKGIRVNGYWFIAEELGARLHRRMHVRLDPLDAGHIWVFEAAGDRQFYCHAEAPELTGIDPRDIAVAAARHARAADAEGRAYARALKREFRPENAGAEILAQAAAADGGSVVAFPSRGDPHSTPALDQAAAAAAHPQPAAAAEPRGADGWTEAERAELARRRAERAAGQGDGLWTEAERAEIARRRTERNQETGT